jgi:hypothetical protein
LLPFNGKKQYDQNANCPILKPMNNVAALEEKRIFLVASNSKQRSDLFTYVIQKHIASAKIFYSLDGVDCMFRISNQVPNMSITRALNWIAKGDNNEYHLRFLVPREVLFRQGQPGDCAYFVRKGELKAYTGTGLAEKMLGEINVNEFVGEMAHINNEPRSATVEDISDCELIEIPFGTLDSVLFSKPAWAKALVMTLSRRLKMTNSKIVNG